eukprot:scaffold9274_cov103-Isochrysis_galbana.AAC.2
MVGVGAGQQSRVDCVKLAGRKVETWYLRQHPKVRALKFKEGVKRQVMPRANDLPGLPREGQDIPRPTQSTSRPIASSVPAHIRPRRRTHSRGPARLPPHRAAGADQRPRALHRGRHAPD